MRRRPFIQPLETRQLLAGDVPGIHATSGEQTLFDNAPRQVKVDSSQHMSLAAQSIGEGETPATDADDLVAFAKAIEFRGLKLFGAAWDEQTTLQKQLFQDGEAHLSFIEVTSADRTPNVFATINDITVYPTWIRPDGQRLEGLQTLQQLSDFANLTIPQDNAPTFQTIGDIDVQIGSPLHLPIDAYDPNGGPLTVSVTVDQPDLLDAQVIMGNRSIRFDMDGFGDMVYELFEQRAPTASGRVIELAQSDFYDGIIFHRVDNGFVIQGGDPTGLGSGGSALPNFDDDFHPELQHNRPGVLSFAKSGDDTNNSQFFVTEVPTRFLDFNHSVFGQLIEGESVREAISNHQVDGSDKPTHDITINSIDVFDDHENSIVMLKALTESVGSSTITVTVTNQSGITATETLTVNVIEDNANSQPFLHPIETPAAGPMRRDQTMQLESTDIEGDEVEYVALVITPGNPAQVSVDDSGLLTVTPASNFSGEVEVAVAVRRGGNSASDDFDRQFITFTFDQSITIPPLIDLSPASDSGISDSDNLTNESTLVFFVEDTAIGDSVRLLVDGQVTETLTADSSSVSITTDSVAAAGEGVRLVSLEVTRNGEVLVSNTIELTYDATAPRIIGSSVPTSVVNGQAVSSQITLNDQESVSEVLSPGIPSEVRLELSANPEGMSLEGDTLIWTPTAQQLGPQPVRFRTIDAAGNTFVETFAIEVTREPVGFDPMVAIELSATDQQGNALTQVEVGQPFRLIASATDLRSGADQDGVYAAYFDLLFDNELIQPSGSNPITRPGVFTLTPSGLITVDGIDELGAASTETVASMESSSVIAIVEMAAIASGTTLIESNPAEDTLNTVLLFGIDETIDPIQIQYGSLELDVVTSWHRDALPEDVNGDETVSPRDALAVINVLAVRGGSFAVYEVDQTDFDPDARYDVTADGVISPRDALVVINSIARQATSSSFSISDSPTLHDNALLSMVDFLDDRNSKDGLEENQFLF